MGRGRSPSPRRGVTERRRSRSRERERRQRPATRRSRSKSPGGRRRSRSPVARRRSRSPVTRRRSRSLSSEHDPAGGSKDVLITSYSGPPVTESDLISQQPDDADAAMMRMMGFSSFDTTKGKKVEGNDISESNIIHKRKFRQYMNRRGGFNRPLDFIA